MREYESRRASEGELSEQDMPEELLAGVETNQTEDDRSPAPHSTLCQYRTSCLVLYAAICLGGFGQNFRGCCQRWQLHSS